ncbi:unnamed protein product, partial [Rotaria socialis]
LLYFTLPNKVKFTALLYQLSKDKVPPLVTIHYVDTNYLNVSKVLSFRRFHGRHFGQRFRNHLVRIVKKFQLESKIVAIVSDNGGDMHFATQYPEMFGVRLHCLAHALNLTVTNGLQLWKKGKKQDSIADLTK